MDFAPHERALARAWGWPLTDGLLPFAALAAQHDGLAAAPAGEGWALPLLALLVWRVRRDSCGYPAPGARRTG